MPSYAQRKVANYRQVQQATTTPGQRVVMCYDAILRDLEKALAAFEDSSPGRLVEIHNALHHACLIIRELELALDHGADPGLCASLGEIYGFWVDQLSTANAKKDPRPIRSIMGIVRELRETWHQATRSAAGSV
jgi:flagellar protein FliS